MGHHRPGPVASQVRVHPGQSPVPRRPHAVALWFGAARLRTLPAAAAPVLLGTAFAVGDGAFHAPAALCALASALLIQVGTNYANDAEDFVRGADTAARVGPRRATAEGWVTAGQMRAAAAVAFGLAFVSGLFLVWRGGPPVLALGLVAIRTGPVGVLAAALVAAAGGAALTGSLARSPGAAAAPILGKTAAVLMLYSLAFALGWVLT